MEILFIVHPCVTRHRLGAFLTVGPPLTTAFVLRLFPSPSAYLCCSPSAAVLSDHRHRSLLTACVVLSVRVSGHPLLPLSVCFCPPSLVLCFSCVMLPASFYIRLSRFPSVYLHHSPSVSTLSVHLLGSLLPFCGSISVVLFPVCFVPVHQPL